MIPAWLPAYDDLTNPKIVQWQADMKKYAPNEQIGGFALSGWTEAQILAEGLKRAGKDLTREKFLQTMDSMKDYKDSILPTISYSADDHAGTKTGYFQKADLKSGKWVIKGFVRGTETTLVANDTDAYHPHAVAQRHHRAQPRQFQQPFSCR